ncbi:hypothetical protein MNBD_IGNAVI01-556 [hydrothermal vent metagenome]|uniref:LUD domain-containing protein n=1 Tax=hydrothermal vent metagenome TaxID=652676 RepID=A0A3B1BV71_9ZZZZ
MIIENITKIIQKFREAAELAAATTEVIPSTSTALNSALEQVIKDEKLVLFAEPTDINPVLFNEFSKNPKIIKESTKEQLATVKCGITDAFGAVASTGSVCVPVTNGLTSPFSMLTRKHIVVLDAKTIVPRPRDVLSNNYLDGKGMTRSFSYITGTSATADMGPLVRGVHGPGELHIIILSDDE